MRHVAALVFAALGAGCTALLGIDGDFQESASGGAPSGATSTTGATSTGGRPSSTASSASQASSTGTGGAATSTTGTGGAATSTTGTGGAATSSTGAGGAGGTGGTSGTGASGPIIGKRLIYQIGVQDQILDSAPVNYTNASNLPSAYVRDPASGSLEGPYAASGDTQGNFTITGVPAGPYVIVFPSGLAYWLTNRELVDFSEYVTSALSRMPLANHPQVHLVVDNMTPWQTGDVLELMDPMTQDYAYDMDDGVLTPSWSSGDTHIDATGDWITWIYGDNVPVQTTDVVSVFHDGLRSTHSYYTLLDYGTVSFSTPDANSPPFDVTVDFVPFDDGTYNYQLNADVPSFEKTVAQANPQAVASQTIVDYQANASPLDHGVLMGTADLAYQNFNAPSPPQNITYTFGSPFMGWPILVSVGTTLSLTVQIPGTTPGSAGFRGIWCNLAPDDPLVANPATPLEPPDAPAAHPLVDGMSIFNGGKPIAITSPTPTITWDASTVPHQEWYVTVYPVSTPACGYSWATCANAAFDCGGEPDGCGNLIQCGTCTGGEVCGAGNFNTCSTGTACSPDATACTDLGIACGPAPDGCGGTVECGSCPAGQTCGGGGVYGQCGGPYTNVGSQTWTVATSDQTAGITIPPGVLDKGSYYLLVLHAVSRVTGVDYETTPNRTSIPSCDAAAVSDLVYVMP